MKTIKDLEKVSNYYLSNKHKGEFTVLPMNDNVMYEFSVKVQKLLKQEEEKKYADKVRKILKGYK